MTAEPTKMTWTTKTFDQLDVPTLYDILAARQDVFIVEQHCPFHEIDRIDLYCHHLMAWTGNDLAAYARIVPPGLRFNEPSIGRILTSSDFRSSGLGRELLHRAIDLTQQLFPGQNICLSGQLYLDKFYREFGFQPVSQIYLEDDIPHQDMILYLKRSTS
ncbi:GNAT family N-acetyltransferase [candidate division KSB1 bacterium]|nr:GNAT family N-acetyltransferase [candidate division KSB1 bacterium]